ncbi:hypothetical protein [uncultured Muribaculum sp.]|uniref:hypothetical protein n=1 Tax=uncultured Muribaculum sp. TaxID=1918613 RepID=UPI002674CE30|nr:hypothetical protein [uncultured Muribaculum sp.]
MAKYTQEQQVIQAMRRAGGFATLRKLNEIVDFSTWKTLTPEASIRRIVQQSKGIFRIQPGLWALEEERDSVLEKLNLKIGNKHSEENFSHSYYQGLLVEIGKFKNKTTYIPAQDRHKSFLDKELGDITDSITIPKFTYDNLLRKARTIDVIWFNERNMPSHFYEVEHTTNIKNSLSKFYELQDFFAEFYIVANEFREPEFNDKINVSMFDDISQRVRFINYDRVANLHANLSQQQNLAW